MLKGHQTLLIIDDCSAEGEINKKRDALSELAFSSRHRSHFLWVLTQKYNSVSKDVREQIKWLCLFFTKDWDSFEDCLRENDVIPDKNERNRLKTCLYHGAVISVLAIGYTMLGKTLVKMNPPSFSKFDIENGVKLVAIIAISDFTKDYLIKQKIIPNNI